MSAYADQAHSWLRVGWGPLPLPAGQKSPPPKHWTGAGAAYPSGADVQAWIEEFPNANLGLRFPANVIGIDVDEYGDKHGKRTLMEHVRKWGTLPPTARITSRPEGISGIYLYRLPELADSAHFLSELPGGNVEILRKEHRYAVGPGSLHPEGRTYEVIVDPRAGWEHKTVAVDPADLPELPASWVNGLTVVPAVKEKTPDVVLAEGRGDRYARSVIDGELELLRSIADWPIGKTDERGRGWEKIQADVAFRLASIALADWNSLTVADAGRAFGSAAPRGGDWTDHDVASKWRSQLNRAEPADPPATSDDPLDPGYFEEAAHAAPAPAPAVGDMVSGLAPQAATVPAQAVAEWTKHSWDDRGNVDRVMALFGPRLKWIVEAKEWMRWDAERGLWEQRDNGGARAAIEMVEALPDLETRLYSTAEREKGKGKTSDRKEFLEWLGGQRFAARYTACARVLRDSGLVDVSIKAFDNEPMLLNVRNGVVDLRTGALRSHEPHLLLRRQAAVSYDPDAKAPRFKAWLEQMMPDADMRAYLQRVVGYSLTGSAGEQVMFIQHGPPAAGKSVFLEIISGLLGEFATGVPPNTLLMKKVEQHPTDIMGLEGRRFLHLDEIPEGSRLDEALVKRLTGESLMKARGMGENFRDIRIVGKVHLVTNHLPHISDDDATKRRLHLIPWTVTIPEEERIQGLAKSLLEEEAAGILAWGVRGALDWQKSKLSRPAGAHLAALDYFEEEDEFGRFMDEKLVPTKVVWTSSSTIYRWYTQWAQSNNVKPMSHVAFGRKLSKRGLTPHRSAKDRGFYCTMRNDPALATEPVDPLEQ